MRQMRKKETRTMPKPRKNTGEKNLISANLIELRKRRNYSQRLLAYKLQLKGYDMDKNVITRIETNKRYVTDIELKALCEVLEVTYDELIDGKGRSVRRSGRQHLQTRSNKHCDQRSHQCGLRHYEHHPSHKRNCNVCESDHTAVEDSGTGRVRK